MPRRADGTWEDKDGNVVYRTDPNDSGVDRSKATFRDGFWIDNSTGEKIPNKNDMPGRVPGTKAGAPGSTVWPDGTPVTPEEHAEINKQASGTPTDPGWLDVVLGVASGGLGTVASAASGKWAGNPPGVSDGTEPSPGAPNYHVTGSADPSGATNNLLPATAPGAELPTTQADEDRKRMAAYLAQLQGQAATGSGAWEGQLARSTQQGSAAASALGQSAAGLDPMAMKRNIGNSTAGVEQRAAGQAETLREQTKQQAQQQLSDINAAQASLDAQQAAEQAAARQGRQEANKAITDEANRINANIYNGYVQAMGTVASMGSGIKAPVAASDGGTVPGKAKVFGDDSANDTVPAMLSPGEIVLPRSVTQSGNPEAAAAAFVQAVKEHHGHHFDGGGKVPDDPWATKPDTSASDALPVLANDPTAAGGTSTGQGYVFGITTPQEAASVRNGGLLDTTAYDASRTANLGSTQAFLDAYAGRGPSVAPQAMQAATDANIAGALSAQTGARGAGRGAAAGLIGGQAAEELSSAGGKAASTAANEAARGGQSYAAAIQRQRQMDLAFALARQQAAWRNSMMNAGIGLQNQAAIRGIIGGAGQAFAAGAGALEKRLKALDAEANANLGTADSSGSDPWETNDPWTQDVSDEGDWGSDSGSDSGGDSPSWASDSDTAYAAHGGEIRARDKAFTRACGFADGGDVPYPGFRGVVEAGETPEQAAARLGYVYSPFGARTPPGFRGVAQPGESPTEAAARLGGGPGPMEDEAAGNALVAQYLGGASSSPPGMVAQMAPGAAMPVPGGSEVVPGTARPAAPMPGVRPIGARSAPLQPDNYALAQQAISELTAANEGIGRAQAEALVGAQKALEQKAIEQKETRARAKISADADMSRILEARQAVASSSSSIDPGRWWASRSTPGKIAAAIGLALGAIGAGNDGVNRAVGIIENAIGRDLEAQKAEHEIRLRKGQMAIDSATSIYTLKRQLAQDDIAASDASAATALEIAKNQVDLATARASSPLAKAQGQMLSAQLGQKRDEHDAATKQRSFDNWVKREDMETRRLAAGLAAGKVDKTMQAKVQAIEAENETIHKAGTNLLKLIKEHGTGDILGPTNAKMRQLVDNMATAAAKLKDPDSAAREGEVTLERRNIFDPGVSIENLRGGAEEKIKAYMANAQTRRNDAYRIRGLPLPGESEGGSTPSSAQTATGKNGEKYRKRPDGKWELVQ